MVNLHCGKLTFEELYFPSVVSQFGGPILDALSSQFYGSFFYFGRIASGMARTCGMAPGRSCSAF